MDHVNRITCDESIRLLDNYLDRELRPEEQRLVEEHLKVCAACARTFGFEGQVIQQIRAKLDRIVLPEDLMKKIRQRLAEDR